MITSYHQNGSDKIPSSLQLRFFELIKTLELDGKSVLEVSDEPDGIGQNLAEVRFRSAEISHIWNISEEPYDICILYSAICQIPEDSIESVIETISNKTLQEFIIIEDLPVDIFSEKELEIRKTIQPDYSSNFNGKLESKLQNAGFERIERKIWASQIPLSEDEVARKIRILSRIAIEKRIDISDELQNLLSIYRLNKPIFTYKELISAYKS